MSLATKIAAQAFGSDIIKTTLDHLERCGIVFASQGREMTADECLALCAMVGPLPQKRGPKLTAEERAAKKEAAAEKKAAAELRKAERAAKKQAAAEAKAKKAEERAAKKEAAAEKKAAAELRKAERAAKKEAAAEVKAKKAEEKLAKAEAAEAKKLAKAEKKAEREALAALKAQNPRPKGRAPKDKTWSYEEGEWIDTIATAETEEAETVFLA